MVGEVVSDFVLLHGIAFDAQDEEAGNDEREQGGNSESGEHGSTSGGAEVRLSPIKRNQPTTRLLASPVPTTND